MAQSRGGRPNWNQFDEHLAATLPPSSCQEQTRLMLIQVFKVRHHPHCPLLLLINCPCRSWLDLSLHSWGRSYLAVKNSSSTSRSTLRRGREFIGFIGIPHWKLLERSQGRLSGRSPFMCLGHFFYLRDHRSWHWWQNLWILSSREIKIQYIRLSMWWEVMILLNKQTVSKSSHCWKPSQSRH